MQPRWLSIAVHWTQCQGAERLAACSLRIQPPSGALDRVRDAKRNRIERVMGPEVHCRRAAARSDKTAMSAAGFVQIAAIHRWRRVVHTAEVGTTLAKSVLATFAKPIGLFRSPMRRRSYGSACRRRATAMRMALSVARR